MIRQMADRIAEFHEQYTTEIDRVNEGYRKNALVISGKGFTFTFTQQIVDLVQVLDRVNVDFYPTWQEASEAAKKLGATSGPSYKTIYSKDAKLPSNPNMVYTDFPGWPRFFGREPRPDLYPTWQEASEAAIKLGARSDTKYRKLREEDLRLPSSPDEYYQDFPGWDTFFGREPRPDLYPTWQEASEAAIRLGIRTSTDYDAMRHKDPRLPSSPDQKYEDFPEWDEFLDRTLFYTTWQEASEAAKKLGIKTSTDYKTLYKEDRRLPSRPYTTYTDFPGWPRFFGRQPRLGKYLTWQEASEATKKLGTKTITDYKTLYKEDPHLPCNPNSHYKDFPGWDTFFGREPRPDLYPTWQEASEATIRLGIKTSGEYPKKYKEDRRLPGGPHKQYKDFPGWPKFLGKK